MIITKPPFSMSFFGGGTDMPTFFNEYGGSVISTTFDKYCYVTVRHLPQFFDYTSELVYSRIEQVNGIDKIEHPLVRNAIKFLDMHELRINYALKGKYASKKQLADEAIYVERELCKESGGWQDQIAASFGGFNRIDFKNNSYEVSPIIISPKRKKQLNDNLMLFFTGFSRFSSEIQKLTVSSIKDKTRQLKEMLELVDQAQKVLVNNKSDLDDFGRLLDATWRLKRQTGAMDYTKKELKQGHLAASCWAQAAADFWCSTFNPKSNNQCLAQCKTCFMCRSSSKTAVLRYFIMLPNSIMLKIVGRNNK